MFATFEYQLSKKEHARGLWVVAMLLLTGNSWNTWRCLEFLTMTIIAVGVVSVIHPGSFPAVLLALLVVWVGCCALNARHARTWHELSYDPPAAASKVTFDTNGVSRLRVNDEHRWSWNALRRIHELRDAIVLEFTGWDHIMLPARLWSNLDERSEFVSQLRKNAPDLLQDFPPEKLEGGRVLVLPAIGAIAATLVIWILSNVLIAYLLFCTCAARPFLSASVASAWRSGLPTAILLGVAMIAGFLINGRLQRLSRYRPKLAAAITGVFVVSLCAIALAWYLLVRGR